MRSITSLSAFLLLSAAVKAQFNIANYPPPNAIPPINSPQMQAWLKEISLADVPKVNLNTGNPPACHTNITADQCWWTCQQCPGTDIETCPSPLDWGLTFDDGPTPNTTPLLAFLKQQNVKATFFVMGSNVVKNPDILKAEAADGHHIASHTWSHHALTTLTNEQIVAEVRWAEKAVFDLTGNRMKYIRPPYGDIDKRVRAVLAKLGYTVIDWTSDAFDTKDFDLGAHPGNVTLYANNFINTLRNYAGAPGPRGIITLEHDLYPGTIELARRIIPVATELKLNVKTVAQCLGDNSPYQNGAGNDPGNNTNGGNNPSGTGPNSNKPSVTGRNAAPSSFKTPVAAGALAVVAFISSLMF